MLLHMLRATQITLVYTRDTRPCVSVCMCVCACVCGYVCVCFILMYGRLALASTAFNKEFLRFLSCAGLAASPEYKYKYKYEYEHEYEYEYEYPLPMLVFACPFA